MKSFLRKLAIAAFDVFDTIVCIVMLMLTLDMLGKAVLYIPMGFVQELVPHAATSTLVQHTWVGAMTVLMASTVILALMLRQDIAEQDESLAFED